MSDTNGNSSDGSEAVVEPWLEYWMKMMEQNEEWMQSLMAGVPPEVDPATVRKEWLGTLSNSMDAYLRTPAFLESMRRNMETVTANKVSTDLAQREMAREAGLPHTEDISGLYERLETANELLLEKLSSIEKRLTAIEKQVKPTTQKKKAAAHKAKPKAKKGSGKKK